MEPTTNGNVFRGAATGFVSGLVASWVMNQFQQTVSKVFAEEEKPHGAQSLQKGLPDHGASAELQELGLDDPRDNAAERTANVISAKVFDHAMTSKEKHRGGAVAHYLMGAASGALYGVGAELVPQVSVGAGVPFGAAVWLVADEVMVPALGLSKSADEYPLSKHAYALSSHLVYGLTTDLVRRALLKVM